MRIGFWTAAFLTVSVAWDGDLFSFRLEPRKGSEMQTSGRVNSFDSGWESWQIYDYNGGSGGENVFFLTSWEKSGGLENSGYVWADESLWHRSWAPSGHSLDSLLKESASYGFSFVGFSEEVTGKLSMDQFEIRLAGR